VRTLDKPLNEIFEQNSLRNLTTHGNNPMPHTGSTFYLWVNNKETELGKYLTQNNSWKSGQSVGSYITLKADLGITNNLIQYGPQSQSSSFTIETREYDDDVIVTAYGWGSCVMYRLFEGKAEIFLEYLKEFQKRSEVIS
jgi:hypothetical protein